MGKNLGGGVLELFFDGLLTITYGGKLLYFRIWCDHSVRSVHIIIITAWFTAP